MYSFLPGPRFNIKMTSYQYRKSHCGDKTILRPSYLHNGISYTSKTTSLYWIRALVSVSDIGARCWGLAKWFQLFVYQNPIVTFIFIFFELWVWEFLWDLALEIILPVSDQKVSGCLAIYGSYQVKVGLVMGGIHVIYVTRWYPALNIHT